MAGPPPASQAPETYGRVGEKAEGGPQQGPPPPVPSGASPPPPQAGAPPNIPPAQSTVPAPAPEPRPAATSSLPVSSPAPTADAPSSAAPASPPQSIPTPHEAVQARESRPKNKRAIHPAIPFLAAVLLIVGVLVALVLIKRKGPDVGPPVVAEPAQPPADGEAREKFLRDGWKEYATNTLTAFLRASTPAEKARYVIGGESKVKEMQQFYAGEQKIDESNTPIDLFNHLDLDPSDKQRGIFLMQFERPAQYDMREFFRPVAPLEIQHELEEPGLLLSAFAARENFAMEPIRVMAFFKEIDNKLLLDWDVYTQTKYRSLRHFATSPQPGESNVFRVMVREVLPATQAIESGESKGYRYFRFADPAHDQDFVDVAVRSNTLAGQILADLAFINVPNKEPQSRYATVRLGWTEDSEPRIELERVLCWEFLGLGGVEGNADPVGVPDDDPNLDSLPPDPLAPTESESETPPSAPPGTDASGVETVETGSPESDPEESGVDDASSAPDVFRDAINQ